LQWASGDATTTVHGRISGSGGLIEAGGGRVVPAVANNSSTATTQINGGNLDIQNAQSLRMPSRWG
jgi:hypothetical protein